MEVAGPVGRPVVAAVDEALRRLVFARLHEGDSNVPSDLEQTTITKVVTSRLQSGVRRFFLLCRSGVIGEQGGVLPRTGQVAA